MNRSDVFAMAAASGICIEDEPGERRHLHGYAPAGTRFAATDTHNIGLWDERRGVPVEWDDIAAMLELAPCDEPGCEHCAEA